MVEILPCIYIVYIERYNSQLRDNNWGMPTVRESIWHGTIPLRIILADNEARNFEKPEYMVSQGYSNDVGMAMLTGW